MYQRFQEWYDYVDFRSCLITVIFIDWNASMFQKMYQRFPEWYDHVHFLFNGNVFKFIILFHGTAYKVHMLNTDKPKEYMHTRPPVLKRRHPFIPCRFHCTMYTEMTLTFSAIWSWNFQLTEPCHTSLKRGYKGLSQHIFLCSVAQIQPEK
jgi:hypothetical protein